MVKCQNYPVKIIHNQNIPYKNKYKISITVMNIMISYTCCSLLLELKIICPKNLLIIYTLCPKNNQNMI